MYEGNPDFSQADLEALPVPEKASLQAQISEHFKTNRYDKKTHELILTNVQTEGLKKVFADYHEFISQGVPIYSIPHSWLTDDIQIHIQPSLPGQLGQQRIDQMPPFLILQLLLSSGFRFPQLHNQK